MCDERYGNLYDVHQKMKEAQPHTHEVRVQTGNWSTEIHYGDQRVTMWTRKGVNDEKLARKIEKLVKDHDQGTAKHLAELTAEHDGKIRRRILAQEIKAKGEAMVAGSH